MDNKIGICLDNEYDTYIEELFFKKVKSDIKSKATRNNIIAAWRLDKKIYTDYSGSISHEFLHYSLHDQSHSISILQYVYLLLGEDLLNNFSVSDLWIMLEVAYSHDIGMSATYEELKEIWNDKREINNIIKKILKYSDREAMELYNTVKDKIENDLVDADNDFLNTYPHWQLEFRKAINYINSEYLRKNHPNKSRNIIDKVLLKLNTEHLNIEERFYKIIGDINYLHGEDFSEIENLLENEELGIETDIFHPRMIEMLLRMGDVLDIRNNRFCLRDKDYLGGLPKDSKEHFLKHKGVTNFLVTNENVRVHIKSNKLEVCKNSAYWLEYIENEYNNFTSHWNDYVSDNLKGLKLKNVDLKIEYNGKEFILQDFSKYLKTDPKKLMQLMVGENLYNTNLIMFREFLQNAIDASKVKLAMQYVDDKVFLEKNSIECFRKVSPKDFSVDDYDDLSINICFDYDEKTDLITFSIADHGIGMDEAGLDALCNIGQGWNHRREIANRFDEFPDWLKPTGGFGIGTLSAFLLTDQVRFKTKSKNRPYYDVKINSPINGNDGAIEKMIIDNDEKISGTEVIVKIDFNKYYYEIIRYLKMKGKKINKILHCANIGKSSIKEQFVFETLENFINVLISNSFFEISMSSSNSLYKKVFKRAFLGKEEINDSSKIKNVSDDKENGIVWDNENEILIRHKVYNNQRRAHLIDLILLGEPVNESKVNDTRGIKNDCIFSYKGIRVNNSNSANLIYNNEDISIILNEVIESIDFYSDSVNNVLDVSRTRFTNEFNLTEHIYNILYNYLIDYINNEDKKSNIHNIELKFAMEKLCVYFYDTIRHDKNLRKKIKYERYLFNKDYYYFNKNEFLEYKISCCAEKIQENMNYFKNYLNGKYDEFHKGDGNGNGIIRLLIDSIDSLLNILFFYKDTELKYKLENCKDMLKKGALKETEINKFNEFLNYYIHDYDNLKYSFVQLLEKSPLNIDAYFNYEKGFNSESMKKINNQKTLYYMEDEVKKISLFKYYINHYVKSYKLDTKRTKSESKFCLIRQANSFIDKVNKDVTLLITNSLIRETNNKVYLVDNSNDVEKYKNLIVTDYFDNDSQQIIISPFSEIAHIFVNDNSISELLKNGYNRQKIINSINKNDDFKKFIDNVYKYKVASVYNEKDKQKISKERIREQYVSLICDVLEEYTNRH